MLCRSGLSGPRRVDPSDQHPGVEGNDLEDASAKIREGGPVDDEEDYAADCWAGIVPITPHIGAVVPDPRLKPGGAARTRHRRHPRAASVNDGSRDGTAGGP